MLTEQISIRVMTMEDYEEVHRLWMEISGFGIRSIDDSKEGVERFIKRNPTTSMAAFHDGKLIGSILCGHDGRRGHISHTAVHPEYRHQGIGKTLVETALESLKKHDIAKVNLVVFKRNEGGNAFWESMGFTEREDLNYRNRKLVEFTRFDT